MIRFHTALRRQRPKEGSFEIKVLDSLARNQSAKGRSSNNKTGRSVHFPTVSCFSLLAVLGNYRLQLDIKKQLSPDTNVTDSTPDLLDSLLRTTRAKSYTWPRRSSYNMSDTKHDSTQLLPPRRNARPRLLLLPTSNSNHLPKLRRRTTDTPSSDPFKSPERGLKRRIRSCFNTCIRERRG